MEKRSKVPSQNPFESPDFIHAENIENVHGNLRLFTFPDGFCCYTHTSIETTELIYNEVYVQQEYLRHSLTLDDAACIFDVGANIGIFTLFAKARTPGAAVHAFEPIKDNYDVLMLNVDLHRLTGVHTHNVALGPQAASQRTFTYYPNMAGSTTATPAIVERQRQAIVDKIGEDQVDLFQRELFQSETRVAPVRALSSFLDEYAIQMVDFLKIDVEGDELAVLQGIAREHVPKIRQLAIEAHTPEIAEQVCDLLIGLGFKVASDVGLASPAGVSGIYGINSRLSEKHLGLEV
jgi:FkbM family methyltransferase